MGKFITVLLGFSLFWESSCALSTSFKENQISITLDEKFSVISCSLRVDDRISYIDEDSPVPEVVKEYCLGKNFRLLPAQTKKFKEEYEGSFPSYQCLGKMWWKKYRTKALARRDLLTEISLLEQELRMLERSEVHIAHPSFMASEREFDSETEAEGEEGLSPVSLPSYEELKSQYKKTRAYKEERRRKLHEATKPDFSEQHLLLREMLESKTIAPRLVFVKRKSVRRFRLHWNQENKVRAFERRHSLVAVSQNSVRKHLKKRGHLSEAFPPTEPQTSAKSSFSELLENFSLGMTHAMANSRTSSVDFDVLDHGFSF